LAVLQWLELSVPGSGLEDFLTRKLHFASAEKVIAPVERAGGLPDRESRLMLDPTIDTGHSGVIPLPPEAFNWDFLFELGNGIILLGASWSDGRLLQGWWFRPES
jgi:hypothetical protein